MDQKREAGEGKDGEDSISSKQTSQNIPIIRRYCCQRKKWLDLIRQKNAEEFVNTDLFEMTLIPNSTNAKFFTLYNSNGEAQDIESPTILYHAQYVDSLVHLLQKQKRKMNCLERENKRLDNVNKLVFNKANYNFDSAERFSRKLYEICGDTLKYWKRIRCASENIRDLVYYFRDEVTAYMIQVRAEDGLIQDKIKAVHKREISYLQEEHEEEKASFIEQINLSRRQMLEREKDHQRALSSRLNSTFTPAVLRRNPMKPLTVTSSSKFVKSNTPSNEVTADDLRQNQRRRWRPFKILRQRSGEQEATGSSSKSALQLDELLHQNQQLVEEKNLLQAQLDQMKLEKEILGSNLAKSEMLNDQKERKIAYLNDSIQQLFETLTERHIKYSYNQEDEEIDSNRKEKASETSAIPSEGGNARKRTVYHCLIKCRDCCRNLPPSMYASVDFHQVISNLSLGTQQVLQSHQITRFGFRSYLDQEEALWKVCSDFVSHSEASNKDYVELMKTLQQCRDRKRECRKIAGKGRPHIRPRLEVSVKGWKITSQRKTKRMRKMEKQNHQLIGILKQANRVLSTVDPNEANTMLQKAVTKLKDNAKKYLATQRKDGERDHVSDEDLDSGNYLDPLPAVNDDIDRTEPKIKCVEDKRISALSNCLRECRESSLSKDSERDSNSSFGLDLLFAFDDDIDGIDMSRIHYKDEQPGTNSAFESCMKQCKENILDAASEEDHSSSFGLDLLFGEDEDIDEIDEDMFWELEDNMFIKHCREKEGEGEGNGYLDSSFCLDVLYSLDNEVVGTGTTTSDAEVQLSESFQLGGLNVSEKHKPGEESTGNSEFSYSLGGPRSPCYNVCGVVDETHCKGEYFLKSLDGEDEEDSFDTTCLIEVLFPFYDELEKIPADTNDEPEGKNKSFTVKESSVKLLEKDRGTQVGEETDEANVASSYCLDLLFAINDSLSNAAPGRKNMNHQDDRSRHLEGLKQTPEEVYKENAGVLEQVQTLYQEPHLKIDHAQEERADQRELINRFDDKLSSENKWQVTVNSKLSSLFSSFNKDKVGIRDNPDSMTSSRDHKTSFEHNSSLRPFATKLETLLNAQQAELKIGTKDMANIQNPMPHRTQQVSGFLSKKHGYVGRERNSTTSNDSNVDKYYDKSMKITRSAIEIQSQYKCTWPDKDYSMHSNGSTCATEIKIVGCPGQRNEVIRSDLSNGRSSYMHGDKMNGMGSDNNRNNNPLGTWQVRDESETKPKANRLSNGAVIYPVSPFTELRNDTDNIECEKFCEIDLNEMECAIKKRYLPTWLKRNPPAEEKTHENFSRDKTFTTIDKDDNDDKIVDKSVVMNDARSTNMATVRAVDINREEIWLSLKQSLLANNKDRSLHLFSSSAILLVKPTVSVVAEISFNDSLVENIHSYLVVNQDEVYYPILAEREMMRELMADDVFHVWDNSQRSKHARELVYYTPNYCRYYERGASTGEMHGFHNMDQPIYLWSELVEAITKCHGIEIHFDCYTNLKTVSCYMVRDNNLDFTTWKVEIRLDQATKVYEEKAITRSRVKKLPMSILLELTKQRQTQDASLYRVNKISDTYGSPVSLRMSEKRYLCLQDGIDFILNTNINIKALLASFRQSYHNHAVKLVRRNDKKCQQLLMRRCAFEENSASHFRFRYLIQGIGNIVGLSTDIVPMDKEKYPKSVLTEKFDNTVRHHNFSFVEDALLNGKFAMTLPNVHTTELNQQWERKDQRAEVLFRIGKGPMRKTRKKDCFNDRNHHQGSNEDLMSGNESRATNKNINNLSDQRDFLPLQKGQTEMNMGNTINIEKCTGPTLRHHMNKVDREMQDEVTDKEDPLLLNSKESQDLSMMTEEMELDQSREHLASSAIASLANKNTLNSSNELYPDRFSDGPKETKNDSGDTTTVLNSIDSQISALPRVDYVFANR